MYYIIWISDLIIWASLIISEDFVPFRLFFFKHNIVMLLIILKAFWLQAQQLRLGAASKQKRVFPCQWEMQ